MLRLRVSCIYCPRLVAIFYQTGLSKKIDKLAKKKDCEDVGQWRQSISNHMYWCAASTPDGNRQLMQEKWKMLPLHIENIHSNPNNDVYSECGHGELEGEARDRLWLQPGMPLTGLFFKSNKHNLLMFILQHSKKQIQQVQHK